MAGTVTINGLPDSGSLTQTDTLFATGLQSTGLLTKSTPAEVEALLLASAAIDSVYGTIVGGVLVRASTGWESLTPGATGKFLSSGTGSVVTPLWQTIATASEMVIDQGTLSVPTSTLTLAGAGGTLSSGGSNQATLTIPGGGAGTGLELILGTTTVSGVETLTLGGGGTLSTGGTGTATYTPPASAGLQLDQGTTTLTGVGTLAIAGGLALSGSGVAGTLAVALTASAPLLGSDGTGSAVPVAVGANLSLAGGTLSASGGTVIPASAPLLGSNAGGTATPVAVGANLSLASGTLSASGGTLPASAALLSTNSGGTATATQVGAGLLLSAGTLTNTGSGGITSLVAGAGLTGGTITSAGTIALAAVAAGLVSSNGSLLVPTTLGAGLALAGGTLSASTPLTLTDGTHSVTGVGTLLVSSGGVVSGTTGTGTLAIAGSGGAIYAPGWGKSFAGGSWARPALSAMTQYNTNAGTDTALTDVTGGPIRFVSTSSVSGEWRTLGKSSGSVPWTCTAFTTAEMSLVNSAQYVGILAANTTSGLFTVFAIRLQQPYSFYVYHYNSISSGGSFASSGSVSVTMANFDPSMLHWRIVNDGTSVTWYVAKDPVDDAGWTPVYQEGLSTFLVSANFAGISFDGQGSGQPQAINIYGFTMTP